jgi:serine phosphatase RsbU (regulator of sigma subunit)
MGNFPDQQFPAGCTIALEHGDTILLLTDGITESTAVDGSVSGTEGAPDFVRRHQQGTAGELVHGLHLAARAFAGNAPQMDDILSAVCRVE